MTDEKVIALTQFQHSRLKVGMYMGSPVVEEGSFPLYDPKLKRISPDRFDHTYGLFTAFQEAMTNACDELFLNKKGGHIDVEFDEKTLVVSVSDSGRGIPFHHDDDLGGRIATIALTEARVGRNFEDREQVGGQNGLGIAVVGHCSEYFEVESRRGGQLFIQRFEPGVEDLIINDPIITDCPKNQHGTKISFKLDRRVFAAGILPEKMVHSFVRMITVTSPSISVSFNGNKIQTKNEVGKELLGSEAVKIELVDNTTTLDYYVAPTLGASQFDMSLVNNLPATSGVHFTTFSRQFSDQLIEVLKPESNKRRLHPKRHDILDENFVFAVVKMDAPNFDSQSKTKLINPEIHGIVARALEVFDFHQFVKDNRKFIDDLYIRVASRSNKKDQLEVEKKAKELRRKKLESLTDATSHDRKSCTIAIFEGHSAACSYLAVRDTATMASIPLRGKIMNCWRKLPKHITKSETIDQICAAVGLAPGKSVDPAQLRYGQVQIYTDQDVDGRQIAAALVALFYQFWPELFDVEWLKTNNRGKPFITIAKTPIVILREKKTKKPFYIYEENGFSMKDYPKYNFESRAKGLGALSLDDWKAHVNDDGTKVAILDDGNLESMLDLHFNGGRADDRKKLVQ